MLAVPCEFDCACFAVSVFDHEHLHLIHAILILGDVGGLVILALIIIGALEHHNDIGILLDRA